MEFHPKFSGDPFPDLVVADSPGPVLFDGPNTKAIVEAMALGMYSTEKR